jgi:CheY-like chemotaxis protein
MVEIPSILVVDDEAVNRGIATVMLEQAGWHVDTVEDGASAIIASRRRIFALVLMDIQMPGMDGFEAAKAIRADGGTVPILAFTALARSDAEGRLESAGMDGYIAKPFTAPELLAAVEPWRPSTKPHNSARLAALFGEAEINAMLVRFRQQLADALAAPDILGERRSRAHRVAGIAGTLGFPEVSLTWLAVSEGEDSQWDAARIAARKALAELGRVRETLEKARP